MTCYNECWFIEPILLLLKKTHIINELQWFTVELNASLRKLFFRVKNGRCRCPPCSFAAPSVATPSTFTNVGLDARPWIRVDLIVLVTRSWCFDQWERSRLCLYYCAMWCGFFVISVWPGFSWEFYSSVYFRFAACVRNNIYDSFLIRIDQCHSLKNIKFLTR